MANKIRLRQALNIQPSFNHQTPSLVLSNVFLIDKRQALNIQPSFNNQTPSLVLSIPFLIDRGHGVLVCTVTTVPMAV